MDNNNKTRRNSCQDRKPTPYPSPQTLAIAENRQDFQSPLVLPVSYFSAHDKIRPLSLSIPTKDFTTGNTPPAPNGKDRVKPVHSVTPPPSTESKSNVTQDDNQVTPETWVASLPRPIPGKMHRTSSTPSDLHLVGSWKEIQDWHPCIVGPSSSY